MADTHRLKLDVVGHWTEIKHEIIREYATAYSKILTAQTKPKLHHVYIDAFAGAGIHLSKSTGEVIDGSPLIATATQPPFREYHFIDLNEQRVENLRGLLAEHPTARVHHGDCNKVMLETVLPQVRYDQYRRGLCLLEPYGLALDWEVIRKAGEMKSIDLFLNFPTADMNRNVFWNNHAGVDARDIARMNAFWGDDSWRKVVYKPVENLFGVDDEKITNMNETVAAAFLERLKSVAGFAWVPKPMPMRNNNGAIVYYLFFASQKEPANKIITHLFDKYRNLGAV